MARDGLAPGVFARVNAGGTPWAAMLLIGVVSTALVTTRAFERLLALAITPVLVVDGAMKFALVRLRREQPDAPPSCSSIRSCRSCSRECTRRSSWGQPSSSRHWPSNVGCGVLKGVVCRRKHPCVPFRLTLITGDDRRTRHSRRRP
ncbi:MAG: hypothetical protein DMG10_18175 [Acidobacteria bacterium]|nr:MAG: hypothetical protein DMG10_18175 [Acidobacteriota bacterium]